MKNEMIRFHQQGLATWAGIYRRARHAADVVAFALAKDMLYWHRDQLRAERGAR